MKIKRVTFFPKYLVLLCCSIFMSCLSIANYLDKLFGILYDIMYFLKITPNVFRNAATGFKKRDNFRVFGANLW